MVDARVSTNPFDDSSSSDDGEEFHDCQQVLPAVYSSTKRSAPLDFRLDSVVCEDPALTFERGPESNELFSPLENALLQVQNEAIQPTKDHLSVIGGDIQVTDSDRLNNNKDGEDAGGKLLKNDSRKYLLSDEPRRVQWKDSVLRHLSQQEHETVVDFKLIILEELGTASSWTLLILPYLALFVCLLLEAEWNVAVDGPFEASLTCHNYSKPSNVPLVPAPFKSCTYMFELQENNGILAYGDKGSGLLKSQFQAIMANGWAYDSGIIPDIPPSSTFIRGDASFDCLSTNAVALVARGMVVVSTVVLQRGQSPSMPETREWTPVYTSKPDRLSLACHPTLPTSNATMSILWNCTAPRIVDMLESMPATAVLARTDLRVNVLYAYHESPVWEDMDFTFVFVETIGEQDVLNAANISNPLGLLREAALSAKYTVEHQSVRASKIEAYVRIVAIVATCIFIVFWSWSMGSRAYGGSCVSCRDQANGEKLNLVGRPHATMWWESPWLLFPERYYIPFLLFALLMVQNPLLVAMSFNPNLYTNGRLHAMADAVLGLGVNLILFVYLCLFHGLRYHTAAVATRRTSHMRQVLNLRRAAKYVTEAASNDDATDESISRYTADYYEQYGDTDGSGSSSAIRLWHDPFGSSCADFLIPKFFILVLAFTSVLVTAIARFLASDDGEATLLPADLEKYEELYIAGSLVQFGTMVIWVVLIFQRAIGTGKKLRKEPFLRTRPAQLAYRILFAQMVLGALALAIPSCIDLVNLVKKWTSSSTGLINQGSGYELLRTSELDLLLRTLAGTARRFPYSGTAASVGPGRIFFATICILSTAVIFLPSHPLNETENGSVPNKVVDYGSVLLNGHGVEKGRQRRDKRMVITIARYTHTWRVFPLPILKETGLVLLPMESSFLLNCNLEKDHSSRDGRSIVFVGSYTPVFCVEIACWLNEASWQAYYSPNKFLADDEWAPGQMNLESLGLRLERVVNDDSADIQVFVATNPLPRVDGEEDSVIVVSFRGSANASNLKTDFRARQVPLADQIIGDFGGPSFRISADHIDAYDIDDHFWDQPNADEVHMLPQVRPGTLSKLSRAKRRAKAVLGSTSVGKSAFPCVHEGFQDVYIKIRKRLLECIVSILHRQLARTVSNSCGANNSHDGFEPLVLPKIYVTGHSMGGSLAQLLALDIASNCELLLTKPGSGTHTFGHPLWPSTSWDSGSHDAADFDGTTRIVVQPPVAVYTFGQPRLGNHVFARLYKGRVPHTFRVAVEGDPVTTLPYVAFCGGLYKHAGLEVVLDEAGTGNTLVGPTVVETLFRFHKVRTDVSAHSLSRYRDCLESALEPHELEEYYRSHGGVAGVTGNDYGTIPSVQQSVPQWMTQVRTKT